MSTKKPWLDALKETIGKEPRSPRENPGKPPTATMQKVQKPGEVSRGEIVSIEFTRPVQRSPDERRLLAAGWSPKDRCGPLALTIWANPKTGFYCSQEVALHRLDRGAGGGA